MTIGAVTPLRGVDYIRSIEIHQDHGDVSVTVNGEEITVTPFPNDIIAGTLIGMVSTLKDVDSVNSLDVSVEAK